MCGTSNALRLLNPVLPSGGNLHLTGFIAKVRENALKKNHVVGCFSFIYFPEVLQYLH